jgi:DNA-binding IclR family transcriptional regulator
MPLPAQPNRSLIDGLAVLQAVVGRGDAVGSRELGRELNLEPTRVNRLLKTLAHLGLTEQGGDRKYRPGPAIHVLAAQSLFGSGLIRRAIGPLRDLGRFDLTVALGVLWRDRVSYLYHAAPGMPPEQALGRAGLFPAAKSGIGVALWAVQADAVALPSDARELVREARERGYAYVPTGAEGIHSLGVAVPDASHSAVAFSGRIAPERVEELAAALRQAVEAIARG